MTVILSGIRPGDPPVPLVLVQCDCCHDLFWIPTEAVLFYWSCACGYDWEPDEDWGQPTLAQADREREGASDAA